MPHPSLRDRRPAATRVSGPLRRLAACLTLALAGCLFEEQGFTPERRYATVLLDTLLPASASPARTVHLYQPLRDPTLAGKPAAEPEVLPPVNVRDYATGDIVQYRLVRQRHGAWTPELEFKWNYFLLQGFFLFSTGLPDTAGLAGKTQGLYERLHAVDAFTHYFDSAAAPAALDRISTTTRPGALGIEVSLNDGEDTVIIRRVVEGSPAARAGLSKGMAILAVGDSSVTGDSAIQRFSRFSTGAPGSPAALTVLPPGGVPRTAAMVREEVDFPSVYVDSVDGVGYIAITGFMSRTAGGSHTLGEFKEALKATRRFARTILDLRDNGGGDLNLTLRMCDEILPAGTVMIRQQQRQFSEEDHVPLLSRADHLATSGGAAEKRKFVLLADGGSASASEIFIAAVREGAGAPFVGERTYGKGVGQSVRETPGRGLSLVTFLKFTTKDGLDYHKAGLEPDHVDTSGNDSQLLRAVAVAKALPKAGAKASAERAALDAALGARARTLEWNRSQRRRPGVRSLEAPLLP